MNHESTDFAAQRFTPRMARDYSRFYAGQHFQPQNEHAAWRVLRQLICYAAAVAIGAMLALGSRA